MFRVHQTHFDADGFNPVPSHRYYGGGRFDSTGDDLYPFMYLGEKVETAVSETLLRDLPVEDTGVRVLPRARVRGRRISAVKTNVDITLVDMTTSVALAAVAQDGWLTWTEPRDYAQTRHWGHWIREKVPNAQGYIWPSRREPPTSAFVLFGDRFPANPVEVLPKHPDLPPGNRAVFDSPVGIRYLRGMLSSYNVTVAKS
jgi:hypothetical protein